MKKSKKNNKGFSLVELIVVIAIMAVLVGVLAPSLIRYVQNSRISTDITNVDNAVSAINAQIASGDYTYSVTGSDLQTIYNNIGLSNSTAPTSKTGDGAVFTVESWNADGTVGVVLVEVDSTTYEVYPDAENGSTNSSSYAGINTLKN